MNPEKLKKLQAQVRIGGKGTPRRKKKVYRFIPKVNTSLQNSQDYRRVVSSKVYRSVYFKCHLNNKICLLSKSVV